MKWSIRSGDDLGEMLPINERTELSRRVQLAQTIRKRGIYDGVVVVPAMRGCLFQAKSTVVCAEQAGKCHLDSAKGGSEWLATR